MNIQKKKKNKNIYILKHAVWVNKIVAGFLLCPASPWAGWSRHKCLQQTLLWCTHGPWAALPTCLAGAEQGLNTRVGACLCLEGDDPWAFCKCWASHPAEINLSHTMGKHHAWPQVQLSASLQVLSAWWTLSVATEKYLSSSSVSYEPSYLFFLLVESIYSQIII